jgi:hypothetical protein
MYISVPFVVSAPGASVGAGAPCKAKDRNVLKT